MSTGDGAGPVVTGSGDAGTYDGQAARAEYLIDLGRHDQAVEILARLLRDFPDHAGATWTLLARAHSGADRHHEAVDAARTAAAHLPQDPQAHTILGGCLLDAGQPADAESPLRTALGLAPGSSTVWVLLSLVLSATSREEEGFQAAGEALRLDPEEALAHYAVGRSLADRSPSEAERAFLEALRLDPQLVPALAGLVGTRLRRGDEVGAARAASSLAALDPGNPSVHRIIDVLLARTLSGLHLATLVGLVALLTTLGGAAGSGLDEAAAVPVLILTALLGCLFSYRRARPLYDALPHGGRSLARSMLRRRRLVAAWAVILAVLWLALAGATVALVLTGDSGPLTMVALAGAAILLACGLLARRDFRDLLQD